MVTLVAFFTFMCLHAVTKGITLNKGCRALLALERFFSCAHSNMVDKSMFKGKDFGTTLALVTCYTHKCLNIDINGITLSERFGAQIIRLFIFVRFNVIGQQFKPSERFGALFSFV
uniref:Putative homeobox transcription factor sip1 n=1 Tax=Ixodes ricinus TaxID=34613 RepID=A0A6B0UKY1_IXORI